MNLQLPRVMAVSPSGQSDLRIVVASVRAGALGILDFGFGFHSEDLVASLHQASKPLKDHVFGIRLPGRALTPEVMAQFPANLTVVVVTESGDDDWVGLRALLARCGRRAVADVVSRRASQAAVSAGFDALIISGNEAGGLVSDESSFILLQAVLTQEVPPVWVRGGIGLRSASACLAAGAAGVVLDGALLLARESSLGASIRQRIERWDGSETTLIGREVGQLVRVHADPRSPALARLEAAASQGRAEWDSALLKEIGWGEGQVRPVGQDASFASGLARKYVTVGGIVQAVERAIDEGLRDARLTRPLSEGSALACSHGTRYPIVQGPMTRVSDLAGFARAVGEGGGLPFLALALMRGAEIERLLAETAERLQGLPWGVGILGFVPPELRREQIEMVRRARPSFALIAGGRPDQAHDLEQEGIATYLHAPSPGLLRQYWNDGVRRFVLEGRECGGHVGPRSSLLLWEQAVDVVLEMLQRGGTPEEVHLLFAGGIHDARSASAVAALAGSLAKRGVRVGVLLGTAYLFTAEAVETGAIVAKFQDEAVRCTETVLLETAPGHEVRVSPTPYVETFNRERKRLISAGSSATEIRDTLEGLNAGRLRIAAKGIDRKNGAGSPMIGVSAENQQTQGLYMLGQAATLRQCVTTIAELHLDISAGATERIESLTEDSESDEASLAAQSAPCDIAIVGMSAIVPGAGDVRTFWENTLQGQDAITEIPADRWDWRLYYDADPKAPDKITSKWGGFVPEIPFDPLRYGMPPTSLPSIEPLHLLTLEAVRAAIDDAGYRDRPFARERTAVVLGAGGGAAQLAMGYAFRSYLPMLDTVAPGAGRDALEQCGAFLPEWTEDSFPGILLNVAAGRVANRFDLGGANYTVDAACGSSLAAASVAIRELESGAADVVILGGADTVQNPFTYLAFSKTHAFSPKGRCRPFDTSADGIVISEAVAVVVLKRLADAERDGDRIYAVIKGMGASSDGRARGLTAPRPEGQVSALKRAYSRAGIDPATVGYVEAHGTGTAAGDLAEVNALTDVFQEAGATEARCALGSVKSLVGHTKCAAGLVGLINATLALHHQVLPPTIGITNPNDRFSRAGTPFHISMKTRPWLHADADRPRRAGVSAFGFGGTNFHAVLEAYEGSTEQPPTPSRHWPAELLVWRAPDRTQLLAELDGVSQTLSRGARPALRDLAHTLWNAVGAPGGVSLTIVANSLDDAESKLKQARTAIAGGKAEFHDPRGIAFAEAGVRDANRVAFLFPGQGAQRLEMLMDLALTFPEIRSGFEAFDRVLQAQGRFPVSPFVFPPPTLSAEERDRQRVALNATEVAQPALGGASFGLLQLLESFRLTPDMVAGHSFGELVALYAGGVITLDTLVELADARGRLIKAAAGTEPGTMAALALRIDQAEALLDGLEGVSPVNLNGPRQTVISGRREAVAEALDRARRSGVRAQELAVSCAFHSPIVAAASQPLAELAGSLGTQPARRPVFSNVTGVPYPNDSALIAAQVGTHVASPVRFAPMIEAMHDEGARIFVEVGPGSALTSLVGSILGDRPHLAVACDPSGRPGLPGFLQTLGRLFVAGVPLCLDRLTEGRGALTLDPLTLTPVSAIETRSATTWLVNGSRARPANGAEPKRLGPGPALPVPHPRIQPEMTEATSSSPRPITPMHGPKDQEIVMPPAHAEQPIADHGKERVLEAFQKTMQTFLEVQRETMLSYLGVARSPSAIVESRSNPNHDLASLRPRATAQASAQPIAPSEARRVPSTNTNSTSVSASASPPAEVVAPPIVTTPAAPAAAESYDVAARLLAIVRDRTGYPAEMLRLDLDLEADLGIDSIKRVEILGTLRDALPDGGFGSNADLMDQLSRARTLGAIVEKVERGLKSGQTSPAAAAASASALAPAFVKPVSRPGVARHEPRDGLASGPRSVSAQAIASRAKQEGSTVRRQTLEVIATPISRSHGADLGLVPSGLVLVTDDGRGIARGLAAELRSRRHPVVIVAHSPADSHAYSRSPEGDVQAIDLTSPAAVESLLARLRLRGPLTGIVHALPLQDGPTVELDPERWSARMNPETRGLFLLARAAAEDLARAGEQGGACFLACTSMGGSFASAGHAPESFFPGHGAVGGIAKTLAREWPREVRVRVVDFDARATSEEVVTHLLNEMGARDRRTEVGYQGPRRVALRVTEKVLATSGRAQLEMSPGEPVLITGGARGITAELATELARVWKPTLLLVGTTPLPRERESSRTSGVTNPATLKSLLHQQFAEERKDVGPAELERAYQALRRHREIRANLDRFEQMGVRLEYADVDVRDARALRAVIEPWQARYGPVRGLIHGAGVIQDKLLRDKTIESFDRVLGTKIDGAINLANLLDPAMLRFAAFFSSVAGRFGNRGQVDYAAANETLNKLAIWLDRRWSGRVVSVNWGPWSGVGMVSDLQSHLRGQGLGMISPQDDAHRLSDELRLGAKGEVEVVIANEIGSLIDPDGKPPRADRRLDTANEELVLS